LSGGTLRSTGTCYGLGGTYFRLEGHTTFWRNTAVYRNMLRPERNILPPGGAHYCLEEHCGLKEHATAWEKHTTAWRGTLCLEEHCGLQEHATAWEEHTIAWRRTPLSGETLLCTGTCYGLGGKYYRL